MGGKVSSQVVGREWGDPATWADTQLTPGDMLVGGVSEGGAGLGLGGPRGETSP